MDNLQSVLLENEIFLENWTGKEDHCTYLLEVMKKDSWLSKFAWYGLHFHMSWILINALFVPLLHYKERGQQAIIDVHSSIFGNCKNRRDFVCAMVDFAMLFPTEIAAIKNVGELCKLLANPTKAKENIRSANKGNWKEHWKVVKKEFKKKVLNEYGKKKNHATPWSVMPFVHEKIFVLRNGFVDADSPGKKFRVRRTYAKAIKSIEIPPERRRKRNEILARWTPTNLLPPIADTALLDPSEEEEVTTLSHPLEQEVAVNAEVLPTAFDEGNLEDSMEEDTDVQTPTETRDPSTPPPTPPLIIDLDPFHDRWKMIRMAEKQDLAEFAPNLQVKTDSTIYQVFESPAFMYLAFSLRRYEHTYCLGRSRLDMDNEDTLASLTIPTGNKRFIQKSGILHVLRAGCDIFDTSVSELPQEQFFRIILFVLRYGSINSMRDANEGKASVLVRAGNNVKELGERYDFGTSGTRPGAINLNI